MIRVLQVLLLLRGVVGVGLGGVPVALTLFAEFCPTRGRGVWLVVLQSFWTAGTMAEAVLAGRILLPWGWRWLLAMSAAPFGEASRILTLGISLGLGFWV